MNVMKLSRTTFTLGKKYVICGKRNCGKTTLINDIVYHLHSKKNNITIFTQYNAELYFSDMYKFQYTKNEELDIDIIKNIISRQCIENPKMNNIFILDDSIVSLYRNDLNDILNLEFPNLTLIIELQYMNQSINGFDIIYLFGYENMIVNKKRIYNKYINNICTFQEFNEIMAEERYGFIILRDNHLYKYNTLNHLIYI